LIIVCANCHRCCRHLFVAAAAVAAVTIVNAAAVAATAVAVAITAVVAAANAVLTVVVAISTAVPTEDNGNGSIVISLGWLWVVA
jgi:hypothetical protein